MCRESIDLIKDELQMLKLTKNYLIKNQKELILYAVSMIENSNTKYKYDLIDKKSDFLLSVETDFKLAIEYCDTLDDNSYEDNRYIIENLDSRIYCDFYNSLSTFINKEDIEDWVKSNLNDIFGFFASMHC